MKEGGSRNQVTLGVESLVVALLDNGVDWEHPALAAHRWQGEADNGVDDDDDGLVDDVDGWDFVFGRRNAGIPDEHGTELAGVVVGARLDASGSEAGLKLMSLRVLGSDGRGYVSWAIEAMDYAIAHGARVALCAWGGKGESRFLLEALQRAVAADIVVIVAAGNDGRELAEWGWYPAGWKLDGVLVVAASAGWWAGRATAHATA
ncbi:MAG: hypothetical protein C4334_08800, partial [Pyrinomonas sp.]|uniref:S8 family serine peptidase n=1 Tax=Pyrinomonas sp. TaxID=2080306 RepID=UPI00331F2A20